MCDDAADRYKRHAEISTTCNQTDEIWRHITGLIEQKSEQRVQSNQD